MSNVKEIAEKIIKADNLGREEIHNAAHRLWLSTVLNGGSAEKATDAAIKVALDTYEEALLAALADAELQLTDDTLTAAIALLPAEPIGYTSQTQLDEMSKLPGNNYVMWGDPLLHHHDIPLYTSPAPHPSVDRDALLEEAREALDKIAKAPAWGAPERWEITPAEVRQLARSVVDKIERGGTQ